MMAGVTSSPESIWTQAVCATVMANLVHHVPSYGMVVLPAASHRSVFQAHWAVMHPEQPMPTLVTMPALYQHLAESLGVISREFLTITDAEAELVFANAVTQSGEAFRPPNLTAARLIRWKMEGLSAAFVQHMFPPEDRPYDLRDLDKVLAVWHAYEQLCSGKLLDRGSLAQMVVDGLATVPMHTNKQLLIAATHGLSRIDRMMVHLLARNGWDVGVQFANHPHADCRSASDTQWLVAHGWHATGERENPECKVSIHAMTSARDEVRRILAAVKVLWKGGLPLHRMCVTVPEGELYTRLFVEHADCGVPLSVKSEQALSSDPQATALHALCMVAVHGWQITDVERLATQTVLRSDERIAMLPLIANKYRIAGGAGEQEWQQRMKHQHIATAAEVESVRYLGKVAALLPKEADSKGFSNGMLLAAEMLGLKLSSELADTLDSYASVSQRLHLHHQTLATHVSQWWQIVRKASGKPGVALGGVLSVVRANEVRLLDYDMVFAPGMAEGILPRTARDTWDAAVADLDPLVVEMERWADVLYATRDGRVVCTWPTMMDDDPTLRSQFLLNQTTDDFRMEVLDDSDACILLSASEALAYSEDSVLHREVMQQGLQHECLSSTAQAVLTKAKEKALSPSGIDVAADCPYKYFAARILRIQSEDETDESMTPKERGELMHAVAQRFFQTVRGFRLDDVTGIQDVEKAMVDLTQNPIEYWMPDLIRAYHAEREAIPGGYLYDEAEVSMMLDTDARPGLLRRWLESEYEQQENKSLRPAFFEVEYRGEIDLGFAKEQVNVRIDRIDVEVSGQDVIARVVDYKTSEQSIPMKKLIFGAQRTQPTLYVLAAQAWFAQRGIQAQVTEMRYHTFGRSVHSQKEPGVKEILPRSNQTERSEDVARAILQQAQSSVQVIRTGRFPVAPREGVCDRCEYKELCRVESWNEAAN